MCRLTRCGGCGGVQGRHRRERDDTDPLLGRRRLDRDVVHVLGQWEQHVQAGGRSLHGEAGQVSGERGDQRVATLAVGMPGAGDMPVVVTAVDELGERELLDRR